MSSLATHELSIGYASPLISGVNLRVAAGEIVAVTGPSGCGKSTLLKTLLGALRPLSGEVEIAERDVSDLPIFKRRTSVLFQEPLLFPQLSARDNISYPLRFQKLSQAEIAQRTDDWVEQMSLSSCADQMPSKLSGGQAQRVALARALAANPEVLLLDEPFTGLDAQLRFRLINAVVEQVNVQRIATVLVTHDLEEARDMADRIVRFQDLGQ